MDNIISQYRKEEVEKKISEIKWTLERNISPFERKILNDVLKIWEKALYNLEGGVQG